MRDKTRYPYQRTRTYITMSGEMDRQQRTVAAPSSALLHLLQSLGEEAEATVPSCLSISPLMVK